jgi:hypothetical protein
LKINTSELVNSGLSDRNSYSPLIADAGQTTMVTGNRFENFSTHVDLSVTNKGVFANNIVNNCGDELGSGVFIYGSVFFLSSPNVLIGPAGEFLPTPDTLNSEYDLINIDLYQAAISKSDYQSFKHVYQENGAVYPLIDPDGPASTIEYRAFFISKNAQGVEEIYGTTYTTAQLTVGKRYTILSLGTTTHIEWNTVAGTSNRVYVVGSSFICAGRLVSLTFTPSQFVVGDTDTYDIIDLGNIDLVILLPGIKMLFNAYNPVISGLLGFSASPPSYNEITPNSSSTILSIRDI